MTFPTTQWSLIAIAAQDGDGTAREALEELCRRYHAPVLAYFKANAPVREDAEDLTQELFAQMLRKQSWLRADIERGQFRSFLLGIAVNALRSWLKARARLKRGGCFSLHSLDLLMDCGWQPAAPPDPAELVFDREWARTVMSAAWRQVEDAASRTPQRAARFAVLRRFLPASGAPPTYADAAGALDTSVDNVKSWIHRLRDDFRDAVRRVIAETVHSGDEVAGEMDYLAAIMTAGQIAPRPQTRNSLSPLDADGLSKRGAPSNPLPPP